MTRRDVFVPKVLVTLAFECPNKRVVTLAEYQACCEELKEENDEGEKELLMTEALEEVEEGPDKGEMLVIRRALSGLNYFLTRVISDLRASLTINFIKKNDFTIYVIIDITYL